MNWRAIRAIVRKDLKVVLQNKGVSIPLIVVPVVIMGLLPSDSDDPRFPFWRDIKVNGNFAYVGSEHENHGIQVFDREGPGQRVAHECRNFGAGLLERILADRVGRPAEALLEL